VKGGGIISNTMLSIDTRVGLLHMYIYFTLQLKAYNNVKVMPQDAWAIIEGIYPKLNPNELANIQSIQNNDWGYGNFKLQWTCILKEIWNSIAPEYML
jgi:hypothetical protein